MTGRLFRNFKVLVAGSACIMMVACSHNQQNEKLYCAAKQDYAHGKYQLAFDKVRVLANRGDMKAQYALGRMYYYGHGVTKDPDVGRSWIRLSAMRHYPPALHAIQLIHRDSKGQDYPPNPNEPVVNLRSGASHAKQFARQQAVPYQVASEFASQSRTTAELASANNARTQVAKHELPNKSESQLVEKIAKRLAKKNSSEQLLELQTGQQHRLKSHQKTANKKPFGFSHRGPHVSHSSIRSELRPTRSLFERHKSQGVTRQMQHSNSAVTHAVTQNEGGFNYLKPQRAAVAVGTDRRHKQATSIQKSTHHTVSISPSSNRSQLTGHHIIRHQRSQRSASSQLAAKQIVPISKQHQSLAALRSDATQHSQAANTETNTNKKQGKPSVSQLTPLAHVNVAKQNKVPQAASRVVHSASIIPSQKRPHQFSTDHHRSQQLAASSSSHPRLSQKLSSNDTKQSVSSESSQIARSSSHQMKNHPARGERRLALSTNTRHRGEHPASIATEHPSLKAKQDADKLAVRSTSARQQAAAKSTSVNLHLPKKRELRHARSQVKLAVSKTQLQQAHKHQQKASVSSTHRRIRHGHVDATDTQKALLLVKAHQDTSAMASTAKRSQSHAKAASESLRANSSTPSMRSITARKASHSTQKSPTQLVSRPASQMKKHRHNSRQHAALSTRLGQPHHKVSTNKTTVKRIHAGAHHRKPMTPVVKTTELILPLPEAFGQTGPAL